MSIGQIASLNANNVEVTTSPTSGIRVVNEKFVRTPGRKYPVLAMLGYGEAVKFNAQDAKHEWMYERTMKAIVTLDAALGSGASDTTLYLSDATVHLVGIGQTLLNGDEWLRVTSVANSSDGYVTVTRGMWGTTLEAADSGDEFRVGPQVFPANAEFEESPKQFGEWDYNYPMIFQYELTEEFMHAAYTNYLVQAADPLAHHMARLKELVLKQVEHWAIYGVRGAPSDYNQMGAFGGIKSFLTSAKSNRIDLPGKLTATGIVDLLEMQYDEVGDLGQMTALVGYKTDRIWDAVMASINADAGDSQSMGAGVKGMTFHTRYGDVKTVLAPSLKDGEMYLLDFGDMNLHPADVGPFGTGWIEFERGVEILNKRTRQQGYGWAGTFRIGDPKKHALLTFPTITTGSYGNYI